MAASAGSGLGIGTVAAGVAVAAVVGVIGYQVVFAPGPDPVPTDTPQGIAADTVADSAAVVPETAPATPPDIAADPDAAPDLMAPRFDLVRVDAAGGALIAGQAQGNMDLRLRLDGQEIHLASTDAGGDFVAMFDIPPSELPRILSLEMLMEDGSVLVSEQSVIISPTLRPTDMDPGVAVAAAEASGPDAPEDSGVTDLALASGGDSPPASSPAPLAPVTPDLPEPGAVATGGDGAAVPDLPGSAGQDGSGPDQPVLETASVVAPADTDAVLTRGLTPSEAGASVAEDSTTETAPDAAPVDVAQADIEPGTAETVTTEMAEGSNSPQAEVETPDLAANADAAGQVALADGGDSPAETGDAPVIETASVDPGPATDPQPPVAPVTESGTGSLAAPAETDDPAELASDTQVAALDQPETPTDPTSDAPAIIDADAPPQPAAPIASTQVAAADSPAPEDATQAPDLEPQAPTVLLADSQGIRVIQQGGQGPQAQVTLDTIAYDTGGDVVLAGRGRAESDVRFYLDNQPIHLAPIDLQGGWRTALPQVDPGTYTLRLDEVSADGAVQSRIETPFLREEPDAVAAITSASGENVITVQWGHTLWGIAQQHFGDGVAYVQIYEANRDQIRNPDLIYPGQIFTLPEQGGDD